MSPHGKPYPDISGILARKAKGRHQRAQLSFAEKIDALDTLRGRIEPIVRARKAARLLQRDPGSTVQPKPSA